MLMGGLRGTSLRNINIGAGLCTYPGHGRSGVVHAVLLQEHVVQLGHRVQEADILLAARQQRGTCITYREGNHSLPLQSAVPDIGAGQVPARTKRQLVPDSHHPRAHHEHIGSLCSKACDYFARFAWAARTMLMDSRTL